MEDFRALPEGTLAELIRGELFMSPAPVTLHQQISRDVFLALVSYVGVRQNKGELLYAPCDVYLDEISNVVQPDIIYVSPGSNAVIKPDGLHGAPDLVIEILSPSNQAHDLSVKKDLYEQFGVREYWIISPDSKVCTGFALKDGKYNEPRRLTGEIQVAVLENRVFKF